MNLQTQVNYPVLIRKGLTLIGGIALILIILYNTVFFVGTTQVGLVMTMGQPGRTVQGGVHFKVPFFQTVKKVENPLAVKTLYLGYRDLGKQKYQTIPQEAIMITSDENLLDVEWMVEISVTDANKALYKSSNPLELIRNICLQDMRQIINSNTMEVCTTTGREKLAVQAFPTIDKDIKALDLGYTIKNIRIQDVQPPTELSEAYGLVNTAQQKRTESVNQAKAEEAKAINEKKSDVAKRKAAADAETNRIINTAKGDVSEYLAIYELYKKSPSMTKSQLLMSLLQKILPKAKVFLVDDQGNTVKYLNLSELQK